MMAMGVAVTCRAWQWSLCHETMTRATQMKFGVQEVASAPRCRLLGAGEEVPSATMTSASTAHTASWFLCGT